MSIQVTCPGCLKRFQVNDKFAGKTGPCPSCSKPIKIPAKSDEVVIHAPEGAGPKDSKGRPVFKPIRREEVKLSLPVILGASMMTILCLLIALIVRFTNDEPPTPLLVLGTIFLAPPLVFAGYWFLRDDELEGYTGRELWIRTAACSVVFMITWGVYAMLPMYLFEYQSLAEITGLELALLIPVMIAIGTAASVLAMELEVGQAALHYLLYLSITLILAVIMGTALALPLAEGKARPSSPPAAVTPATKPNAPASPSTPTTPPASTPGAKAPATKTPPATAPSTGGAKSAEPKAVQPPSDAKKPRKVLQ